MKLTFNLSLQKIYVYSLSVLSLVLLLSACGTSQQPAVSSPSAGSSAIEVYAKQALPVTTDKALPVTVSNSIQIAQDKQKWEYKFVEINNTYFSTSPLEKQFNDLGDSGWELVSVIHDARKIPDTFVFKRLKAP